MLRKAWNKIKQIFCYHSWDSEEESEDVFKFHGREYPGVRTDLVCSKCADKHFAGFMYKSDKLKKLKEGHEQKDTDTAAE